MGVPLKRVSLIKFEMALPWLNASVAPIRTLEKEASIPAWQADSGISRRSPPHPRRRHR
jgi:hypothetical protein